MIDQFCQLAPSKIRHEPCLNHIMKHMNNFKRTKIALYGLQFLLFLIKLKFQTKSTQEFMKLYIV